MPLVGNCQDHPPELVTDQEDNRCLTGHRDTALRSTDDLGWRRSAYRVRDLSDAERRAVEAAFRFDPPDGPDGRSARWRRHAAGRREHIIDGRSWGLTEASLVVAVYDGLNEKNKARYAAYNASQMVNIAVRITGLA